MRELAFEHMCQLDLGRMVTDHYWNLRIVPHDDPSQTVRLEEVVIEPGVLEMRQHDGFGNVLLAAGSTLQHNSFGYRVSGTAIVDSGHGRGNKLNPIFRFASKLTTPGPALEALQSEAGEAAGTSEGGVTGVAAFERANQLRTLVYETMEYVPGSTTVLTTAEEAIEQRRGVCQDYAHILAALLRMDRIPARYVGGMMLGEGATHAWVEFYDGTTWWGVDPTNNCEAGDYYIALVRGRDHSDCPMERGVFRGAAMQHMVTHVKVSEL